MSSSLAELLLSCPAAWLSRGMVSTIANAILGITALAGQNLGTNGAGAPPTFGSIGFPGGSPTVPPHPPNQPSAVNLVAGTPFVTGQTLVYKAVLDSIFRFQVDASSASTYNATTALIGTYIGLTADGNGTWYADLAKSTVNSNAVIRIIGLDALDFRCRLDHHADQQRSHLRDIPGERNTSLAS